MSKSSGTIITPHIRCAIYVRKSTEENLNTDFNSLDVQREACEAYVQSRKHDGWVVLPTDYSDGGYTGANMDRPAFQKLLKDVEAGRVDVVLIYKLDRLSRSLLDFAKLVGLFERYEVSFVSITQNFDSSTPVGRLCINMLMSFSQFEREIIGERIRDKVAAAKRRGKFMGGTPPLGYDVDSGLHKLVINEQEAETVRFIFKRFAETGSPLTIAEELNRKGITTKAWMTKHGAYREGKIWHKSSLYRVLNNRTYLGEVIHKDKTYPGEHDAIIAKEIWDRAHRVMENNTRHRTQEIQSKSPALLMGIIRCGACNKAMSPVATGNSGRTYRYYTCGHASKAGHNACPVKSVPAGDIETAVVEQLRVMFRSPEVITDEQDVCECLRRLDLIWDDLFPLEQRRIVQLLVDRVTVNPDGMDIQIRNNGLNSLVSEIQAATGRHEGSRVV